MPSPAELARLYDDHAQALFAFVLDLTGNDADTRDVLQETFIRVARSATSLAEVRSERGYLVRIAHNAAVDLIRRRGARQRAHDGYEAEGEAIQSPVHDPDSGTFHVAMDKAVHALPLEQRGVVHLKLWGGLTFDEIAAALDIPANTAASRYRYGIDKLRDLLRPLYEEIR